MSSAAALVARWRVRLGYFLAVFVLFFARPTPKYVAIGAAIADGAISSQHAKAFSYLGDLRPY